MSTGVGHAAVPLFTRMLYRYGRNRIIAGESNNRLFCGQVLWIMVTAPEEQHMAHEVGCTFMHNVLFSAATMQWPEMLNSRSVNVTWLEAAVV